jgi:hypothetical protein
MSEQDETPAPEPGQDVTVQAGLASATGETGPASGEPEPGENEEKGF